MPEKLRRVSAYQNLRPDSQGILRSTQGKKFEPSAYSEMKWGVVSATKRYAEEMVAAMPVDVVYGSKPPGVVVEYEILPHAGTLLGVFCLDEINKKRADKKLSPGELVVIKAEDYIDEYSHLPEAQREQIIQRQKDSLRLENPERAKNLHLIFIDDIYVSGTTEKSFVAFLRQFTPDEIIAAYIATVDPVAKNSPELEGKLDDSNMGSLQTLLPFIQRNDLRLIHKIFKELLLVPLDEVNQFFDGLSSDAFRAEIHDAFTHARQDVLNSHRENSDLVLRRSRQS